MFSDLLTITRRSILLFALVPTMILSSCEKNSEEETGPNRNLNKRSVGDSAHDLLSADNYKKVIVEIQYAQGYEPTAGAINNLKSFINKHMNKPGGIILKQGPIPAPGKPSYSAADIAAIEDKHRSEFTRPDTIAMYFFFADSKYAEDTNNSKILGIAYRNTSMALFENTVRSMSGGLGQPDRTKLETVVMQHEVGHILGLVNAGTNMVQNHQDAPHGRHCTNSNCLMHYTVETGNVVENLLGSGMPVLDEACVNDLKANGGK